LLLLPLLLPPLLLLLGPFQKVQVLQHGIKGSFWVKGASCSTC
jgi:hypothetical protein